MPISTKLNRVAFSSLMEHTYLTERAGERKREREREGGRGGGGEGGERERDRTIPLFLLFPTT
jgi:hypothetical protein